MRDIPKGNIRLIGLDLDDTVLNSQKHITPKTRDAIARAVGMGIQVLPATGRARNTLPEEFVGIPGVRYAVCTNGAMVYDLTSGKVLYDDCFDKKTALKLLKICDENGMLPSVFIEESVYCDAAVDLDSLRTQYDSVTLQYFRKSRIPVKSLQKLIEDSRAPVQKFTVVFADVSLRGRAREVLLESGLCSVTSSLKDNLEINTPTANKGKALVSLGKKLGIPKEEIMAIGDGTNDLEMLRHVGWAVAMGNAHRLLLEVADYVTATADEDGVAQAIEAVLQ